MVLEPEYKLPPKLAIQFKSSGGSGSAVQRAKDVVSSMLAKGFVLGKDVLIKAKAFDEKIQLTSTASAKVASIDQKIGFSEKISLGETMVNDKMKEMDQKIQVSEKTKSAFAATEQTIDTAGSTIMKNNYILTGTSWFTGVFSKVTKAAGEVEQKAKEKMAEGEQEKNSAEGYELLNGSRTLESSEAARAKPSSF